MKNEVILLLSTFPDSESARFIVTKLVEERLVACGNMLAGVESIYRWKGKIEQSAEIMVLFKTTANCADAAIARLKELHPYEVPEVLMFRAAGGLSSYLDWVAAQVG